MPAFNQDLPIPGFYNADQSRDYYYEPDPMEVFEAAEQTRLKFNIRAGGAHGEPNIIGLLIDGQRSFCFPPKTNPSGRLVSGGSLYVAGRSGTGAMDDNDRTARFGYTQAARIRKWKTTFDTHFLRQIFFAGNWVGPDGKPLQEHTLIELAQNGKTLVNFRFGPNGKEIIAEGVQPNPAIAWAIANGNYTWLQQQWAFYNKKLAEGGKYTLYLWPYHCLLGTMGHSLAGVLQGMTQYHAFLRGAQNEAEVKGGNPHSENYSVFEHEVLERFDGKPLAQRNVALIKEVVDADAVVVLGQAGSHCVPSSVDSILNWILVQDKELAKKFYLVRDCMSPVVIPGGPDFTPQMDAALSKFASEGMHVVESTTPMEKWDGLSL